MIDICSTVLNVFSFFRRYGSWCDEVQRLILQMARMTTGIVLTRIFTREASFSLQQITPTVRTQYLAQYSPTNPLPPRSFSILFNSTSLPTYSPDLPISSPPINRSHRKTFPADSLSAQKSLLSNSNFNSYPYPRTSLHIHLHIR